jgi:phosphohistidine phosphatase SixA
MSLARVSFFYALLTAWSLTVSPHVWAQTQPEWLNALRAGGHVIIIRHGATYMDQADTDPLNMNNVAKQRQLNDAGRAKAKEMGEAFRKLKIPVGPVVTSMFFRAIETGKIAFGDAAPTIDVAEGGLVVSPNENNRRTAAMRKLASTMPPAGTNVVVVSHKPNILDAFGKDWFDVREGEASIFKPDGHSGYKFVVRVPADEWKKLADSAS